MISDRPGGLADLTAQIAASGASIKQVVHDRAFAGSDVSAVHVLCTVETRNRDHLATLRKKLRENGVETTIRGNRRPDRGIPWQNGVAAAVLSGK